MADYDGFLGDVLQRKIYITFKTKMGNFYKLFYSKINDNKIMRILRSRYLSLSEDEFRYLYNDILVRTDSLQVTKLNKLKLYELFYGRGTRYIIHGGIVMKSQFFSVVPMFVFKSIFKNLMSLDNLETVSHQSIVKNGSLLIISFFKNKN